jgi:hypothetical protein
LGCSTNLPSLSSSVVRELGSTFCQLDAAALTDDQLNAKDAKPSTVRRPNSKKAKKSEGSKDGAGTSKTKEEVVFLSYFLKTLFFFAFVIIMDVKN